MMNPHCGGVTPEFMLINGLSSFSPHSSKSNGVSCSLFFFVGRGATPFSKASTASQRENAGSVGVKSEPCRPLKTGLVKQRVMGRKLGTLLKTQLLKTHGKSPSEHDLQLQCVFHIFVSLQEANGCRMKIKLFFGKFVWRCLILGIQHDKTPLQPGDFTN